ncbi:DUF5916 domain-containing protein [Tenuifilum thalassicum]|uniref:Carbohydrate binding family 9 domain-containing protein n=1 Tax=Tenuifilum thalassicum TaxID=2590900 RepID=A0A7D3XDU0_9BACT|nr:DUF5916 domain-containing protein [Tenuifilum thalassicum]QKG79812.1 carbohydrate binding family 9 domain-containing protein [Tenuifilum thalassicum]
MTYRYFLLASFFVFLFETSSDALFAQGVEKKSCFAVRANPHATIVDGELSDEIWTKGVWSSDFTQHEPHNGSNPSQKTEFKIAYDDDYLYAAFRMYDDEPDKIVARVTRRDDTEGDYVAIGFDSYFDKRTAFVFLLTASGSKMDMVVTEDGGNEDENWDPIWWGKAKRTSFGWTAEMKIPLNQLRFSAVDEQVWGLQVGRHIYRNQETDFWQHIPKDAAGFVHLFGNLYGLKGLTPKRQVEIAPYVVAKTESFKPEEGNPFMTGRRNGLNVGADAKIGLTNNFTLDLTVNPDFGQVEADPAEVNLTAFETYFEEKRPFFIEGSNLFSFPLMFGDGDLASNNLFYSRRIGRAPQRDVELADNEYAHVPSNTTILGAAKVTGRTPNGFSLGVLESVTGNAYAQVDSLGRRYHQLVEPLTNYTVLAAKQELNDGNTIITGMLTSTNRSLNDITKDVYHKNAITGGVGVQHMWADKKYAVELKLFGSHVDGTKDAILITQTSSARYFQRPDIKHVSLDSSRTALNGSGGMFQFGKIGQGHIRYMAAVAWRSPQFEINDIGYTPNVDDIFQVIWVGLRYWEPTSIYRSFNVNFNQWTGWNFGGDFIQKGANVNLHMQLPNYWSVSTGVNWNGEGLSVSELRGGPALLLPGGWNTWYNIQSDGRKRLILGGGGSNFFGFFDNSFRQNFYLWLRYKPSKSIQLSLNPSFSHSESNLAYVTNVDLADETKYIRGFLNRDTWALSLRLEYSINPELSVQYYGRPYFTSGKYTDFKYITNPKADNYSDRFMEYTNSQLSYNNDAEEYSIDENTDGALDYTFSNPNFNYLNLQSNLIVRWEFRPGSSLYLVWTHGKEAYESIYSRSLNDDVDNLWDSHPHNVFLVKFSYRFN